MKYILSYFSEAIRQFRSEFLQALGMSILLSLSSLAGIVFFRLFLTHISSVTQAFQLAFYVVILCLLLLASTLMRIGWSICLDKFGGEYIAYLVAKCQKSIYQTKQENINAAKIGHTLYADILNVFRVIGNFIPNLLCSILLVFLLLGFSLAIDIKITVFLFCSTVVGIFLAYFSKKLIVSAASNTNSKLKDYHTLLNEYTDKIAYIRTNLLLPYYAQQTQSMISAFIGSSLQENKRIYFFNELTRNYNFLMQFCLSFLLSLPFYKNSLPNLAFYIVLFGFLMAQGESIELLLQQIHRHIICFKNVEAILKLPVCNGSAKIATIHSISVNNLSFRYAGKSEYLFKNFNLQLERGDFVLLKGKNGTGKSTLFQLLLNQYTPSAGNIMVNGSNLSDIDLETYYQQLVYLSQQEPVLDTSMQAYLNLISAAAYNTEEIKNIAASFNISYLDSIHEAELSGGESKKLLLAKLKACEKKADLILLDEVDAELDAETKLIYYAYVNKLAERKDKIIIVIQHNDAQQLNFNKTVRLE